MHGKECVCTQKPTSDAAENGESGVFKYSQAILRYSQKWEQAQSLDFEIFAGEPQTFTLLCCSNNIIVQEKLIACAKMGQEP